MQVDVWGFGVVLWELLTQEIPYKNISPMAIMYGVGSGQLHLHIPKTAPDSVRLLLRSCWAKRPRNRPTFISILNHLANIRVELNDLSTDSWQIRKEVWHKEIDVENERLQIDSCRVDGAQHNEEELINKRVHELRHAQEIRQMYEGKMRRVNKMLKQLKMLENIKQVFFTFSLTRRLYFDYFGFSIIANSSSMNASSV